MSVLRSAEHMYRALQVGLVGLESDLLRIHRPNRPATYACTLLHMLRLQAA